MGQDLSANMAAELNKLRKESDAIVKEVLASWTDAATQMGNIGGKMASGLTDGISKAVGAADTIKKLSDPMKSVTQGIQDLLNTNDQAAQSTQNIAGALEKGGSSANAAVGGVQAFGGALNTAMGVVGLVVMAVTTLISIFQELNKADAAYQALADGASDFKAKCEEATIAQQQSLAVTQAQGPVAQGLVDKIKGLTDAQGNLTGSQSECAQAVAELNQMYPGLNLQMDANTGKLNMNTSQLENNVAGMQKMAEAEAMQSQYKKLVEQKVEAELNRKVAIDKVKEALVEQGIYTEEQAQKLDEETISAMANNEAIKILGQTSWVLSGNTKAMLEAVRDYDSVLGDNEKQMGVCKTMIDEETQAQTANTQGKQEAAAAVQSLTEMEAAALIAKQENNETLSEEDANALEAWKGNNQEKYDAMVAANELEKQLYDQKLSYTKDAFTNVQEAMNEAEVLSVEQMTQNLKANQEAMEAWTNNQKILTENGLGGLVRTFSEMGAQGFAQAQYLVDQIQAGADMSELKESLGYDMQDLNTEVQNFDYAGAYNASKEVMTQSADGINKNPVAVTEARNQINLIGNEMRSAIKEMDFTGIGKSIIDDMKAGMLSAKQGLFETAETITGGLKSRLRLNGKVAISGSGSNTKVSLSWYDKGGYFNSPQLIGIAEKRPEFVGAAEDLESFISKSVNNAFVRIDPSLLHDIGGVGGGSAYGAETINFNPRVVINTQKLTDAEMRRATDYVSREFAKTVTGRKVGRLQ